jgi:hypothetical protein
VHLDQPATIATPLRDWKDVLPAPRVVAEVRVGDAPRAAPEVLAPFVVPVATDFGADWELTVDFLATDAPNVASRFFTWRSTWMHSSVLDPMPSILALAELFDNGRTAHEWTAAWAAGEPVVVRDPLDLLLRLGDAHRQVVARRHQGIGIIDVSRGERAGRLTRAWSSSCADLLSATGELQVMAHPHEGLCVVYTGGADRTALRGVSEVVLAQDSVHVQSAERTDVLTLHAARPLAWLAPGATRWKVRPIPEAVVWATTFHRLRHACIVSADHDLALELRLGLHVADKQ